MKTSAENFGLAVGP